MKESEQIGEVDPKSTIEATCVDSAIEQRIMPLHHHEPFALEALHTSSMFSAYQARETYCDQVKFTATGNRVLTQKAS